MRAVSLSLVAVGLVGLALGCSSSETPTETLASPGAGCNSPENAGKCGQTCARDDECGAGMYCNLGGTCSADCGSGLVCPGGATCDAHGQCNADISSLDASVDGDPDGGACPNVTVNFEKTIPTVVLLVDQSGSMSENFGGDTRWNVARKALITNSKGRLNFAPKFSGATYALKLQEGSDLLGVFETSPGALLLRGVVSPNDDAFTKTELTNTPAVSTLKKNASVNEPGAAFATPPTARYSSANSAFASK